MREGTLFAALTGSTPAGAGLVWDTPSGVRSMSHFFSFLNPGMGSHPRVSREAGGAADGTVSSGAPERKAGSAGAGSSSMEAAAEGEEEEGAEEEGGEEEKVCWTA
eukprot:CAMPEP_0180139286 /NCGR_PEP_ID=MMETSP0986-20121125/13438_1 /TAXON_ID=697907 /ORGANISM="non described non described, Strain CCMP2293" /LENGTH=105 /DNA_ID=CAMNT_0022081351 /DNA_START=107 /DNA_END=421 /DNA_ORIENTATION=-